MVVSRWFMLAVLFAARFALGYQFQSAGSVAPFLMRDFGIDYTQVGLLVGGFILPGIAISLPSGFLGRRFGDKSVVTTGMALMVLGGAIASFAPSYSVILFGQLLAGVGGAILIVLMSKADRLVRRKRASPRQRYFHRRLARRHRGGASDAELSRRDDVVAIRVPAEHHAGRARIGADGGVLPSSSRPAARCTRTATAPPLAGHPDCLSRRHQLDVSQRR